MNDPVRVAMWSGPRNISTAMMRSFENRNDTSVVDEPFYAAYLMKTGLDHPLRDAVLMSQPLDWQRVVQRLLGPIPNGRAIFYQKHMTHHMLPEFGRNWISRCRNVFLIRAPEKVLASYTEKRAEVTLADIGFVQQRELFEREADRLGHAPPVMDSEDVLRAPRPSLTALCTALAIPFLEHMLKWPAGKRSTDGIWAPAWYDRVEQSTGFAPSADQRRTSLPDDLKKIADTAQPHYERLAAHRIGVT